MHYLSHLNSRVRSADTNYSSFGTMEHWDRIICFLSSITPGLLTAPFNTDLFLDIVLHRSDSQQAITANSTQMHQPQNDGYDGVKTVDFSSFTDDSDKQGVSDAILSSLKSLGFVCITNHGLPDEEVQNMFSWVLVSS